MSKRKLTNQDIIFSLLDNEYYRKNLLYLEENDSFLFWENNQYRFLDDEDLHNFLRIYVCENYPSFNLTRNSLRELRYLLKLIIPKKVMQEDSHYLGFKDKVFNLKTFEEEEKDRKKVTSFNLPYNYDEVINCETPVFDNFLRTTLVDDNGNTDDSLIELVQEMFGSILLPNVSVSRAWFLVGGGANGKSVLTQLLEDIFPQESISAMNLETLTTNKWAMAHLVGKRLNISTEEESKYIKSDKFKSLIFGDTIYAERKFGGGFEFKPKAKFVFSTNRMPAMGTINTGLKRRIMIVPFKKYFGPSEQDHHLNEKLRKEIPGVVSWAITGASKLVANGYKFSRTKAVEEEMKSFVGDSSSPVGFIKENYRVDSSSHVPTKELYEYYKNWCVETGRKYVSKHNFIKDITEEFNIPINQKRIQDGAKTKVTNVLPLMSREEYEQDIDF